MSSRTTLITAACIAPMTGRVLREGAVAFANHRITAVGSASELLGAYPDADVHDAANSIILPGLINAHTHLELSNLRPGDSPGSFVDWVINLLNQAPRADDEATILPAAFAGASESIRFGVTCVGDITANPRLTRSALRNTPLRVTSFGEVRAMAQRRQLLDQRLTAAITQPAVNLPDHIALGISPHAPYSIEPAGYSACLNKARRRGLLLTTHLAETPDESAFLSSHAGPLRRLWDHLGGWDENVPRFDGGPIRYAQSLGLFDYPTLLAHVNYCDDAELSLLAAGRASVVYCPRTHAYFNHPPHRWREMLAAGVNVSVGTDSTASSPDLNLVNDLRLMHRIAADVPSETLWELATLRAARALNVEADQGSLSPGKLADFTLFESAGSDPLTDILESDVLPSQVWIAGARII